jgi:hypothetical protein
VKKVSFLHLALLIIASLTLAGCPEVARRGEGETPEQHYYAGGRLIERGQYDEAMREFERSVAIDPDYGPGYGGMGLAYAYKGDFGKAREQGFKGRDKAKNDEQKIMALILLGRIHTLEARSFPQDKFDDRRNKVHDGRDRFREAITLGEKNMGQFRSLVSEAYFYLGRAYMVSYEFSDSATAFRKVLELDDPRFREDADREYAKLQKIERAAPGTQYGKEIALVDQITRAHIAALFITELELDKKLEQKRAASGSAEFRAPDTERKFQTELKAEEVTDIKGHWAQFFIGKVVELNIVEVFPDHTFRPEDKMSRASYALMVQEIVIQATNDNDLATKFFGSASPFPDVRNDHYAFNAIMVSTTRGIMEAKVDGTFGLNDTVSGADALLIIRKLKEVI